MEQYFYKDYLDFLSRNLFLEDAMNKYLFKKNFNRKKFNSIFLDKELFKEKFFDWYFTNKYNMSNNHLITFEQFIQKTASLLINYLSSNYILIRKTSEEDVLRTINKIDNILINKCKDYFKGKYAIVGDYFVNINYFLKLILSLFKCITVDIIKKTDKNFTKKDIELMLDVFLERNRIHSSIYKYTN